MKKGTLPTGTVLCSFRRTIKIHRVDGSFAETKRLNGSNYIPYQGLQLITQIYQNVVWLENK